MPATVKLAIYLTVTIIFLVGDNTYGEAENDNIETRRRRRRTLQTTSRTTDKQTTEDPDQQQQLFDQQIRALFGTINETDSANDRERIKQFAIGEW